MMENSAKRINPASLGYLLSSVHPIKDEENPVVADDGPELIPGETQAPAPLENLASGSDDIISVEPIVVTPESTPQTQVLEEKSIMETLIKRGQNKTTNTSVNGNAKNVNDVIISSGIRQSHYNANTLVQAPATTSPQPHNPMVQKYVIDSQIDPLLFDKNNYGGMMEKFTGVFSAFPGFAQQGVELVATQAQVNKLLKMETSPLYAKWVGFLGRMTGKAPLPNNICVLLGLQQQITENITTNLGQFIKDSNAVLEYTMGFRDQRIKKIRGLQDIIYSSQNILKEKEGIANQGYEEPDILNPKYDIIAITNNNNRRELRRAKARYGTALQIILTYANQEKKLRNLEEITSVIITLCQSSLVKTKAISEYLSYTKFMYQQIKVGKDSLADLYNTVSAANNVVESLNGVLISQVAPIQHVMTQRDNPIDDFGGDYLRLQQVLKQLDVQDKQYNALLEARIHNPTYLP